MYILESFNNTRYKNKDINLLLLLLFCLNRLLEIGYSMLWNKLCFVIV